MFARSLSSNMQRQLSLLVLIASICSLLLAACGDATTTSAPAVATTAAPAATTAAAAATTAASAATTAAAAPGGATTAAAAGAATGIKLNKNKSLFIFTYKDSLNKTHSFSRGYGPGRTKEVALKLVEAHRLTTLIP